MPTIWLLHSASRPLGVWLGVTLAEPREGSPPDQAFLLALLILGIIILIARWGQWSIRASPGLSWLGMIFGYSLLSVCWSDVPLISFKRWTREIIAVVMVITISSEKDARGACESIFKRVAYILIPISVVLIKYYPELGVQYSRWEGERMWVGATTQKNALCRLCALSMAFFAWRFVRGMMKEGPNLTVTHRLLEGTVTIAAAWLFLGPQGTLFYSATAFAGLMGLGAIVAAILILWRKGMKCVLRCIAPCVILLFLIGTLLPFKADMGVGLASRMLDRDETLTDRTQLWDILRTFATEKLLTGHGAGGFWTNQRRAAIYTDAHNGYLEIILNTGMIGLFLCAGYVLSITRFAIKVLESKIDESEMLWTTYLCGALIFLLLQSFAESSLASFTTYAWASVLFWAWAVSSGKPVKENGAYLSRHR